MSADNWATCPQCLRNEDALRQKAVEKLALSYGKISQEEFETMSRELPKVKGNSNLREDYEIRTNDLGQFKISYFCSCDVCGFNQEYRFEKQWKVTYSS